MKKLLLLTALFIFACSSDLFTQDYMKMNKKNLRVEYQKKLNKVDSLIQVLDITYSKNQNLQSNLKDANNDLVSISNSLNKSNLKISQLILEADSLKTSLINMVNEKRELVFQDSLKITVIDSLKNKNETLKQIISNTKLGQTNSEYKISTFLEYGWFNVTITHKQNIIIMLYSNENTYHTSGNPMYILDGKIGKIGIEGENPNFKKVDFELVMYQEGKSDLIPCENCIYYYSNDSGKDILAQINYEDMLNETIAQ